MGREWAPAHFPYVVLRVLVPSFSLVLCVCLVDFYESFLVPLAAPHSINSASSHSFKNQPKTHTFCRFRNRKSLQRKRRTFAFEPSLLYQKFFANLQFQGFSAVAPPPPPPPLPSSQTEEEDSRENWGLLVLLAQQLGAKMAAAFPSKSLHAARSLLGGLGNNLGVQGTPHEMSCSEFLFQVRRPSALSQAHLACQCQGKSLLHQARPCQFTQIPISQVGIVG
ncbi:uncharacterized protein LOC114291111 isoform X9 [Camellia sinensis]|uniref:uncharacterized protein LOC114291111 isoform X9 n=1 Tax=Camellia sinensis TaxID=4442 RepID=UPI00103680E6|nr:uncharacterized protein LOC114291111 isoform X9 [Camellia sinensis]